MALIVLIYHCTVYSGIQRLNEIVIFFPGNEAVFCFFIISGFLITMSYERDKNLKRFFLKRAKRIFPLYFAVVLISVFVMQFVTTLPRHEYWVGSNNGVFYYLIANLSTLGFLCRSLPGVFEHNTTTSEVNGSLWTIKIELAFYLFLPVLCAIRNKISSAKNKNIFLAMLYVLSLLWRYTFLYVSKITHSGLWGQIGLQFPGYVNF